MKNKNVLDHFLDILDDSNNKGVKYKRVYKRMPIFKSLVHFIFSLVCIVLLIIVFGFSTNILFLLLLFGFIIALIINGINLFTREGIRLPVHEEISDDHDMSKEDRYKIQ